MNSSLVKAFDNKGLKPMGRNARWLVCLTALLCVFIAITFYCGEVKAQTVGIRPTPHVPLLNRDPCQEPKLYYCSELIDVKIGQYLLKIPHNLIGNWPPGNNFIELLPKWPGLKGRIKDEKFNETFTRFDIFHVMIHNIRRERPTEEGVRSIDTKLKLNSVSVPKLGLIEHRNPQINYLKVKDFAEYYTPINQTGLLPNNQPLAISRSYIPHSRLVHPSLGKVEDAGTYECEYGYTLRDNLYVTVRFYDKHLKDWKQIVSSTQTFVESLLKD